MALERIKSLLNAPHPPHFDGRTVLRNALLSGVIVGVILAAFQPFDLSEIPDGLAVPVSLGFGVVTAIMVLLIGFVVPKLIPQWFNEDRWTVWRNVLHTITVVMFIGLGNLLYLQMLGYRFGGFWRSLGYMELYTFAIAVFPIALLTLVEQNRELKKHAKRAATANEVSRESSNSESGAELLVFQNEQGRPELQIRAHEWKYIRADKNYLDVYFDGAGGKAQKHVLRNRLSKVCNEVNHPDVFHCHRSYAVNIRRVQRIEGNARGYVLHLDVDTPPIPVSRSKTETLFERLDPSR